MGSTHGREVEGEQTLGSRDQIGEGISVRKKDSVDLSEALTDRIETLEDQGSEAPRETVILGIISLRDGTRIRRTYGEGTPNLRITAKQPGAENRINSPGEDAGVYPEGVLLNEV